MTPGNARSPGELTLSDLFGSSLSDIVNVAITGGADLRADAVVDFSSLGSDFANILPSISMKILIDFGLAWSTQNGFVISSPQVVFGDITLDLGSFISKFAGPILNSIKQILDPLAWLIGPSGFLNERIPLISDLAGHTITGADIVEFFDPTDAPTIKSFLVVRPGALPPGRPRAAGVERRRRQAQLRRHHARPPGRRSRATRCADCRGIRRRELGVLRLAAERRLRRRHEPRELARPERTERPRRPGLGTTPSMEGAGGAATSGLLEALDPTKTFDFPLLDNPSDLINLLFGKPVTLVQINVPTLTFNFTYMQEFPIIGPLVGTFEGGIGATINLSLGYDTQGLSRLPGVEEPGRRCSRASSSTRTTRTTRRSCCRSRR